MWTTVNQILSKIDDFVWGPPLMVLIMVGGILLTIRMGVLQIRKLPLALKFMIKNEEGAEGEVSSFGALCTALSATIGTGNIVGVATAIGAGGPGALFWMVLAAFFGMATKYAEGLLAVKYRVIDKDNHALGGPFYYIEKEWDQNGNGLRSYLHFWYLRRPFRYWNLFAGKWYFLRREFLFLTRICPGLLRFPVLERIPGPLLSLL